MAKEVLLTQDGYDKIVEELELLKTVKRAEMAEKIKEARSFGDLSENSEYDEAKNEQAQLEARINEIEAIKKVARIITKESIKKDTVFLGTKVSLKITEEDGYEEEIEYEIVGSSEADPVNGKISDESPVGKALNGHSVGEKVTVDLGYGATVYEILAVETTI